MLYLVQNTKKHLIYLALNQKLLVSWVLTQCSISSFLSIVTQKLRVLVLVFSLCNEIICNDCGCSRFKSRASHSLSYCSSQSKNIALNIKVALLSCCGIGICSSVAGIFLRPSENKVLPNSIRLVPYSRSSTISMIICWTTIISNATWTEWGRIENNHHSLHNVCQSVEAEGKRQVAATSRD
jgi:hypothetical protein